MRPPAADFAPAGRAAVETDSLLELLLAELRRALTTLEASAERFEALAADEPLASAERAAVATIRAQAGVIRVIVARAILED